MEQQELDLMEVRRKNNPETITFDDLCIIYDLLLTAQKRSTTVYEPLDPLDGVPFMLMNIREELNSIIKRYCEDNKDNDRPTYYRLK